MTGEESLREIRQLLQRFPGVTSAVVFRHSDEQRVGVRFRCINTDSLKMVAQCALWANVAIMLGDFEMRICAEPEGVTDLPCDMSISDDAQETPTQTEIFGVYLSDYLRSEGLISSEECRRLHEQWNTRLARRRKKDSVD